MNAHTTLPDDAVAAIMAEMANLRAEVADLRGRVVRLERPRPRKPPSARDCATLAEVVGVLADDREFQFGDLTDDPEKAKAWGEALARLLPHSPVGGIEIERIGKGGNSAWWRLRYVGRGTSGDLRSPRNEDDPGAT